MLYPHTTATPPPEQSLPNIVVHHHTGNPGAGS